MKICLAQIEPAHGRMAQIAQTYGITTLMVNCVGLADGEWCAGQSAVWNPEGQQLAQFNDLTEGVLVYDTIAQLIAHESVTPE